MAEFGHPNVVLELFAARPSHGSEGGVGWEFLRAAAELAVSRGFTVQAVVDECNTRELKAELASHRLGEAVVLHGVRGSCLRINGGYQGKSRSDYLLWRRDAALRTREIVSSELVKVVHQITFASAILPPVDTRGDCGRRIWGPVALPVSVPSRPIDTFSLRVGTRLARWWASDFDLVICQNQETFDLLDDANTSVRIEPNIVVPESDLGVVRDCSRLVMVGVLDFRKRPWLAIEALCHAELQGYSLTIVGDGPLKEELGRLCLRLGLSERVDFVGNVSHERALSEIASSAVLVHPSRRDGAAWVVGEAASVGTPAVVFEGTGAATALRMSGTRGAVVPWSDAPDAALAQAISQVLLSNDCVSTQARSGRWSPRRLQSLLTDWWGIDEW